MQRSFDVMKPNHRVPRGGRSVAVGVALLFAAQSLRACFDEAATEPMLAAPAVVAPADASGVRLEPREQPAGTPAPRADGVRAAGEAR